MKSYITAAIVFAVLLLTVPAAPILLGKIDTAQAKSIVSESKPSEEPSQTKAEKEQPAKKYETLKVLDITTGKVEEISAFDYVVGAVCAEMPATFEPEALKAQAVAAYTYAVRQAEKAEISPVSELCGAYFSNDSSKYQAYFTENQAKQYYGENYDDYIKKIKTAVSEVEYQYMTYDNEPIIAAFHSLSTGKTESAQNVWGSDIAYLTSVTSEYDTKSPGYTEIYEFSESEMKELLESAFNGITLPEKAEKWFSEPICSDAQTVLTITVGDMEITGQELRTALSLRSASFEIEYDDGFKVTTKGCGHCVGMSQYGANEMAKTGNTYEEILEHYYKGVKIKNKKHLIFSVNVI